MENNNKKFNRERQIIFREEVLDDCIKIPNLLEKVGDASKQKDAILQLRCFGYGASNSLVLVTKSLETDEEWAARLREMDRKAEASRKRKEAAEKKELAELARLKAKYESNNPKEDKRDE